MRVPSVNGPFFSSMSVSLGSLSRKLKELGPLECSVTVISMMLLAIEVSSLRLPTVISNAGTKTSSSDCERAIGVALG